MVMRYLQLREGGGRALTAPPKVSTRQLPGWTVLQWVAPVCTRAGVVTPIRTICRAATGDCDPIYGGCMGVAYCITPYTTKTSHSHSGFCDGHRVAGSLAVFGQSQYVTTVAALSMAHFGVATPCRQGEDNLK